MSVDNRKALQLQRAEEIRDLRKVLDTTFGRKVLWRLLEECKTFSTVMTGNSWTHYNAGKQDLGHFLMSEIVEADEEYLFKMMKENKVKGETNVRKSRPSS